MDPTPRRKGSPRISVITVTKRPGSIDITWASLERQTFQDFEWILCDELYEWRRKEVAEYVNDPRLLHIASPIDDRDLWNLNKASNEALRHCRGELVVWLQDYIWSPHDGLQKFWDIYRALGPHLVTGCGHKAAHPSIILAEGKITIFSSPYTEKPTGIFEPDCRMTTTTRRLELTNPSHWELNWAAAPLSAFTRLGGFEEKHDREFYSCDNLSIAFRAQSFGYQIFIDGTNECTGFPHQLYWPRPQDWDEKHGMHGKFERWYRDWLAQGMPKLPYL